MSWTCPIVFVLPLGHQNLCSVQSEKLKDVKVDIALIGQGTNLDDPELLKRIKKDDTLVGFEHSHKLTINIIDHFKIVTSAGDDTCDLLGINRDFNTQCHLEIQNNLSRTQGDAGTCRTANASAFIAFTAEL